MQLKNVATGSNLIVVSSNDDCQELQKSLVIGKDCNSEMPFESAVAPYTILIDNQRSSDINKILAMVPDSVDRLLIIGATGWEVKLNGLTERNLSDLKQLQVTHCQLKEVPSYVFNYLELELLNLSHNLLKELPEVVWCLGNLKVIHLQDNRLKKIPDGIGSLDRLEVMNMAKNNLSPQLPITFIGHLRKCKSFSFDDNPLTLVTGSNNDNILRYLEALTLFRLDGGGGGLMPASTLISSQFQTI